MLMKSNLLKEILKIIVVTVMMKLLEIICGKFKNNGDI